MLQQFKELHRKKPSVYPHIHIHVELPEGYIRHKYPSSFYQLLNLSNLIPIYKFRRKIKCNNEKDGRNGKYNKYDQALIEYTKSVLDDKDCNNSK